MPLHILPRRPLRLLFIGGSLAGAGQQYFIPVADIGADHYLKLPGVGEAAFNHRQGVDAFRVGLRRIVKHEAQTGNAVADGGDIIAAAHQRDQSVNILLIYFAHHEAS